MIIVIKEMNKYLNYMFSPFYFSLAMFLESLVIILIFPKFWTFSYYSQYDLMVVVIIGVLNVLTQILLSVATKLENATVLAPLHYLEVITVLLTDLLFFEIKFSLLDIIGIIIVSVCILIPLIRKSLTVKHESENFSGSQEGLANKIHQ